MPRNASGVYSLPVGPFAPGGLIKSADMNSNFNDIATALTSSLPVNGAAGMTGPLLAADGAVNAPGIAFAANATTGFYRTGSGQFVWVSNGVAQGTFGTAGLTIGGTLGVTGTASLGNVSITGSFSVGPTTFTSTASFAGAVTLTGGLASPLTPANGGSWVYYGAGGGTANAQTVPTTVPAGLATLVAGDIIVWNPSVSNTTAMTLAAGAAAATNVFKQSLSGPVALSGGEVVANQLAMAIYDGTRLELLTAPAVSGYGALTNLASAATTDLGTIASRFVNVTGTTGITSFGSSATLSSPLYIVTFAGSLTITASAAIITPGGSNVVTAANDTWQLQYLGSGNWQLVQPLPNANASGSASALAGYGQSAFYGLVVQNNGGTPTTKIDVTCTLATVANPQLQNVSFKNVSITINSAANGANGLDSGSMAAAANWYYVYLISNGNAVAGLLSLNATSPTLPTGYTYYARVGAMQTDATPAFYRSRQVGKDARWTMTGVGRDATFFTFTGSTGGVYSAITVTGNNKGAPPTATKVVATLVNGASGQYIGLAPNANYQVPSNLTNPAPVLGGQASSSAATAGNTAEFVLESSSLYYCSATASVNAFVQFIGWADAVNAV